jgi:glycosyltransferase involved in cell wall biosynthesis
MRLSIVTVFPAPYRAPFYEAIDALLDARGGGLTVIYSALSRPGLQWPEGTAPTGAVESIFLSDRAPTLRGRTIHASPRLVGALRHAQPDVVVLGGYAPWIYPAALWCRLARVPYLIWSGETLLSEQRHGNRRALRRPLLRAASGYLAYGPDAAEYLHEAGASEPVTVVGNGIDIDGFAARVAESRTRRDVVRDQLGLAGQVILNVGGKGVDLAADAVSRLEGTVCLAVVGRTDPVPRTRSLGKIAAASMPDVYAAADCLVHLPELDQWPHAINEALAAGLPVVAARGSGVPDDVFAGPRCALVSRTAASVETALIQALEGPPVSEHERDAIRAPLRPWDVRQMAGRVLAAAESVARN